MKTLPVFSGKVCCWLIIGQLLSPAPTLAESWNFRDNSVGMAVGDQKRTPMSNGTKFILDGQFGLRSEVGESSDTRNCCRLPSRPERISWLMNAQFWWDSSDGLEFTEASVTPRATIWTPEIESQRKLRTTQDLLELGATRFIFDDALEVNSYFEIMAARAGRSGVYQWAKSSPFTIRLGGQAAIGWSWGDSDDPVFVERISNPTAGIYGDFGLEHDRLGEIYFITRFANGFSFSNPSRGHPTVREARIRGGYVKQFANCLRFDLFFEKRSFDFDERGVGSRYTESETVGLRIACHGI